MKLAIALTSAWIGLSLLLLVGGERWLHLRYRVDAMSRFSREAPYVQTALSGELAKSSQPSWDSLESKFNVRISDGVPVPKPIPIEPFWERDTMTLFVELPGPFPAASLHIQRDLGPNQYELVWRRSLGLSALLGCSILLVLGIHRKINTRREDNITRPWVSAVDSVNARKPLSLPPLAGDSTLHLGLGVVGDAVNSAVLQLYGANRRSDLVLGNLQEGVLAIDPQARVLLANTAFRIYLELTDNSYLYRPLLEVIRNPSITELVQHVLNEGSKREIVTEVGAEARTLRITGHVLPMGDGAHGALLTFRDETLLNRIDSVRRDFISNASHELKTPLAAIRAYAETLQLGALDDRDAAEDFVNNIITQADRIDGLVQGMLQLSRVESGSAMKIEWFDALEAMAPCIAAAEATSRNKNVDLSVTLPEGPINIRSDRNGFQTIVGNLLSNAVRYTQAGGSVAVSITSEQDECLVQIRDTGIGIQAEDLERIFERFYRAHKDRNSATGGTGLGLSIVKHLTNALGGKVNATSTYQQGSCFEVSLPIDGFGGEFLT